MNPKKEVKRLRQTNHHLEAQNKKLRRELAELDMAIELHEEFCQFAVMTPEGFEFRSFPMDHNRRTKVIQMQIGEITSAYELSEQVMCGGGRRRGPTNSLLYLYQYFRKELKNRGYEPGARD